MYEKSVAGKNRFRSEGRIDRTENGRDMQLKLLHVLFISMDID